MSHRSNLLTILLAGATLAPAFLFGCANDASSRDAAAPTTLQSGAESEPPAADASKSPEAAKTGASSSGGGPSRRGRARVPVYRTIHEASVPVQEGAALVVNGHNGAVVVEAQDRQDIFVEATIFGLSVERSAATDISVEQSGSVVRIGITWPESGPQSIESGAIRVLTPLHTRGVEAHTTAGPVVLTGVGGDALVRTSEGDVQITDQRGAVDAETTRARITIASPGGAVAARTEGGVISISAAPSRVVALTSNAGVDVRLNDESRGPVRIETSNAVVLLTVGDAFVGTLTAETTRSPIDLGPGIDPAKVEFGGASKARFDFGGGEPSMIKTVRGGIRVSRGSN